ncbi:cupin domain-containing protein [Aquimarina sp. 2201CG5-10]|uniref:cupin domain-containing protein n=1 Tax=Aquimarina callyspongiae TaxID=3098150 RepID=UPI002AB43D00|nr:cupin domain-containing protein [Aquimarina sp. 2201CG5-10]MDY8136459.1 cupin domain-containing protein [Aquimarina sp. 2201CG5-10]
MATLEQLKFVNTPPKGIEEPYSEGTTTIKIPPSHLLTPHWHPNSNEITTCTEGEGIVTLIAPNKESPSNPGTIVCNTYQFKKGDSVFLPQGYFHYFLNSGTENFTIDLTFNNKDFDILSLNQIISLLPEDIKISAINSNPTNPVIPYKVVSQEL